MMFKKNLTMHPELCFQEDYTTLMLLYCIHQKTKNETTFHFIWFGRLWEMFFP